MNNNKNKWNYWQPKIWAFYFFEILSCIRNLEAEMKWKCQTVPLEMDIFRWVCAIPCAKSASQICYIYILETNRSCLQCVKRKFNISQNQIDQSAWKKPASYQFATKNPFEDFQRLIDTVFCTAMRFIQVKCWMHEIGAGINELRQNKSIDLRNFYSM